MVGGPPVVVLTRDRGTGLVGAGPRESGGVLGQRCWGHTRRRARGAKAQAPGRLHTAAALRQDTGGFTETYVLIMKLLCETPRKSLHCGRVEGEVTSLGATRALRNAIHPAKWDDSQKSSWGVLEP